MIFDEIMPRPAWFVMLITIPRPRPDPNWKLRKTNPELPKVCFQIRNFGKQTPSRRGFVLELETPKNKLWLGQLLFSSWKLW